MGLEINEKPDNYAKCWVFQHICVCFWERDRNGHRILKGVHYLRNIIAIE